MNQHDIQIWNDAVKACRSVAWDAVVQIEQESPQPGMPSDARSVIRAVANEHLADDDRNKLSQKQTDMLTGMFQVIEEPVKVVPDLVGRELLELFVSQYISGAQGCSMDYDAAQSVAVAIDELLKT
jgi:hypothetical protein